MGAKQLPEMGGPRLDSKVDGLVTHCLYLIATGKWQPGTRLPSIRQAESLWDLNRLTVQKAYRRLEEMGLVRSRIKSGYYVGEDAGVEEISRHRYALENFFNDVSARVKEELELSVLGVFRYMVRMAEIEISERPEHAFIECTQLQARGHADEIIQRLDLPVMPFSMEALGGKFTRIPGHIRMVFTTYFHFSELQDLEKSGNIDVIAVPVEVSPGLKQRLAEFTGRAYFLEIEDVQARNISEDSMNILNGLNIISRVVSDVEFALVDITTLEPDAMVLLSPRLWGSVSEKWRRHSSVTLVEFRICPSSWPMIARRAGLPLGAV